MSSEPWWRCVRWESWMNKSYSWLIVRILKIVVEHSELSDEKHSFIYYGLAWKWWNICVIIALLKYSSDEVELPVEIHSGLHCLRSSDERLHDTWHYIKSLFAKDTRSCWNLSPADELKAFLLYYDLEHLHSLLARQLFLWKEEHSYSIVAFLSKVISEFRYSLGEKLMWYLKEYTYTVSGLALCVLSCSVLKILNNLESIVHCVMCLDTFDIDNGTDTTVIVLKAWVV